MVFASAMFVGTMEWLPSNRTFDKQTSGYKKGGGVRGVGQSVG